MAAPVKRLGLLLPSSGTIQEVDFYRRVPDDVTVHAARMRLLEATEAEEIRMLEEYTIPAARDLATIRPDVVVFSCTSAGALRGNAYEEGLCAEIAAVTRAPVVSTMAAVREGLLRLAVRSVAVVTPYPDALNRRVKASLEADGFRVTGAGGMDLIDSLAIGEVAPAAIHAFAVEQFAKAPAEAIFIACCTFQAFDAKAAIERTLGVPVVTSNQAALEAALRILRIGAPAHGV
ncbi:MAG: aspartate/glutamate racemase family protein [Candidatus Rokubacteria bacterium]|nr:aspartate/glutamate racemase family protein [Candidatus Rokubacteria bacterium]